MPAEAAHPRTRQRVERSDERRVVHRTLPSLVEAALDREAFRDDLDRAERCEARAEFTDRVAAQPWGVFVLERRFHDLRERVEPRDAVVDLKQCDTARFEY